MSDIPGNLDLISDIEDHVRQKEAEVADLKRDLEARRSSSLVLDEDGNDVSTGKEVAVTEDGHREAVWAHTTATYKDEVFNVRRAQPQALGIFSIIASKYISEEKQRDMIGLFLRNHMSPMSFDRFAERCLDPDDTEFDQTSMGELMRLIATGGTARPTVPSRG